MKQTLSDELQRTLFEYHLLEFHFWIAIAVSFFQNFYRNHFSSSVLSARTNIKKMSRMKRWCHLIRSRWPLQYRPVCFIITSFARTLKQQCKYERTDIVSILRFLISDNFIWKISKCAGPSKFGHTIFYCLKFHIEWQLDFFFSSYATYFIKWKIIARQFDNISLVVAVVFFYLRILNQDFYYEVGKREVRSKFATKCSSYPSRQRHEFLLLKSTYSSHHTIRLTFLSNYIFRHSKLNRLISNFQ